MLANNATNGSMTRAVVLSRLMLPPLHGKGTASWQKLAQFIDLKEKFCVLG